MGPDLSNEGTFRSLNWLVAFIDDPKSVQPGSTMPGFKDTLDENQVKDIAAFLYNQRGQAPEATPTPAPTPTPTATPSSGTPGPVSFSTDVKPILSRSCVGCHGAAALGGLNISTYDLLMKSGVVKSGNSAASELYQTLTGKTAGVPSMPPGTPLSAQEIDVIGRWIDQGAANN